jgi:hypothetical protein
MTDAVRKFSWIKFIIVAVPVWLMVSGGIGLWLHFRAADQKERDNRLTYQKQINATSVIDDFKKITDVIGARHVASEQGRAGLTRMAAMIEGSLGPSNMGYQVIKHQGPLIEEVNFPLIEVAVMPKISATSLWVVVPYDAPADEARGAAAASSLAVSFAVAQALVAKELPTNIHFLFVPHAFADEDIRMNLAGKIQQVIDKKNGCSQVLVIGSQLHPGDLFASSRNSSVPLMKKAADLVEDPGAEAICMQDNGELSAILFEAGLPSSLLLTQSPEEMSAELTDSITPQAQMLGDHAAQVLAVILRLAEK